MRRHGYTSNALIETLHSAQECFGYLDKTVLRFVAASLRVPLSKVHGVASFYHFFTLTPPPPHQCIVCLGTACYVKGARQMLSAMHELAGEGNSLQIARCVGTCGLAPLAIVDDEVVGHLDRPDAMARLTDRMRHDTR